VEIGRHWNDGASLGARARFEESASASEPSHLWIDDLRDGDEGVYRCRVDFRQAPTRNVKIQLNVISEWQSSSEGVSRATARNKLSSVRARVFGNQDFFKEVVANFWRASFANNGGGGDGTGRRAPAHRATHKKRLASAPRPDNGDAGAHMNMLMLPPEAPARE